MVLTLVSYRWCKASQPFWYQGPVLWKTIFPQTRVIGGMVWGWFKHITFTVHFISNLGFQGGSGVKNLPANAEDVGLMPGIGIVPGGGKDHPLQYSCLGNPKDRGAWWTTVHGAIKSRTWLSIHAFISNLTLPLIWRGGTSLHPGGWEHLL